MKRKDFIKVSGIVALSPILCSKILAVNTVDESYEMTIRIHHFFDIIQTLGIKKDQELVQAKTKHSYHTVTNAIRDNANIKMKIVLGVDSVCKGCIHNIDNECTSGTRKTGFSDLNDFNNYLDKRIMDKCQIELGQIMTPKEICLISDKYIDHIDYIYEVNKEEENKKREKQFTEGLEFYSERNNFLLDFL